MLLCESWLTTFRSSGALVFGVSFLVYKHSAPPELTRLVAARRLRCVSVVNHRKNHSAQRGQKELFPRCLLVQTIQLQADRISTGTLHAIDYFSHLAVAHRPRRFDEDCLLDTDIF